jgi:hypothetical protein
MQRARAGAVPPLDTPTTIGSRSMTAGVTKLESAGRSTTHTGTPARRAARDTDSSTFASPLVP